MSDVYNPVGKDQNKKMRTLGAQCCCSPCSIMPFPRLTRTADDCVVELYNLASVEVKRKVQNVPFAKVVLARQYAVSICYVIITSLRDCATQGTDNCCICCNTVTSVRAFKVRDSKRNRYLRINGKLTYLQLQLRQMHLILGSKLELIQYAPWPALSQHQARRLQFAG
jgi:hypothetical protein